MSQYEISSPPPRAFATTSSVISPSKYPSSNLVMPTVGFCRDIASNPSGKCAFGIKVTHIIDVREPTLDAIPIPDPPPWPLLQAVEFDLGFKVNLSCDIHLGLVPASCHPSFFFISELMNALRQVSDRLPCQTLIPNTSLSTPAIPRKRLSKLASTMPRTSLLYHVRLLLTSAHEIGRA